MNRIRIPRKLKKQIKRLWFPWKPHKGRLRIFYKESFFSLKFTIRPIEKLNNF